MRSLQEYSTPEWLIEKARPGDRVTIMTPHGSKLTGRVVMARPNGHEHLVLNLGGRYGTPGIATVKNIVSVKFVEMPARL
jgi:hypothetical protein